MKFYYFHLMPYIMEHDEPSSWVTLSNRHYDPGARPHALQPVPRPVRARRAAGLGRSLRQRAPPELLRHDAEPQRDGGHARAAHDAREDRDPRQRPAAAREPAAHRRGDRDARRRLGRPRHLRVRARHQRGVLLDRPSTRPTRASASTRRPSSSCAPGPRRARSPSTAGSIAIPT